jgi:hypothetical protein
MSRHTLTCVSTCVISIVAIGPLQAQSFRTVATSRLFAGDESLFVNLEFAAGTLLLAPGDGRTLYRGELYYDEDKFAPVTTFDAKTGRLDFGLTRADKKSFNLGHIETSQRLTLRVAPQVPSRISVVMGATEAEIELGGLSLSRADISSGAAKANLSFSRPNKIRCDRLTLKTGAAEFNATGLGNSRCTEVSFAGGVGDVLLDFTGEWNEASVCQANINLGFGQLTIRLPRGLGVAVDVDRFLASFDRAGLNKVGSEYQTPNYASAEARLHITIKAALGDIHIDWADQ